MPGQILQQPFCKETCDVYRTVKDKTPQGTRNYLGHSSSRTVSVWATHDLELLLSSYQIY